MFDQADPSDCGYLEGLESFSILLELVEHQDLDDNRYEPTRSDLELLYTNVDVVLTTKVGTTVTQTGTTTAPVVV